MVHPAAEGFASRSAALWALLRDFPGRAGFALRLALICTLSAGIALLFRAPEAALAVYVVLFMNKPDRASSLLGSLALTVVISLVIVALVGICALVLEHPAWRVANMVAVSLVLLWLVSASKLRPVGGTLTLVLAYAMDLLGSIPTGEAATRGFLYAWQLVAIPAGVSILVNLLMAPAPRTLLQAALAERLRTAAVALLDDAAAAQHLQSYLRGGLTECNLWLRRLRMERGAPAQDMAALEAASDATFALLSSVELSRSNPAAALPGPVRRSLSRTLTHMAGIFAAGGYPVDIEAVSAGDGPLSELARAVLADINATLRGFAQAPVTPPPEPPSGGFLVPDAFSNPEHARYALKTTAAAMACYLLYSLLNWPGIHTCMLTCYIVSLATLAESVEKLVLRLIGCLIGAALGLAAMLWVIPGLGSVVEYLALIFAGALLSAWIAVGNERIAYAGFQMALAFFMCVIQGSGPGYDMVVARDRIIGILLGNAVAYIVAAHVWPVSVRGKIEAGIDGCLGSLRHMLATTNTAERRRLAATTQTLADAVRNDLDRAHYEPERLRPSLAWLASRRQIALRLSALSAPCLLFQGSTTDRTDLARRLARAPRAAALQAASASASASAGGALTALIDRQVDALGTLWTEPHPHREIADAPT